MNHVFVWKQQLLRVDMDTRYNRSYLLLLRK